MKAGVRSEKTQSLIKQLKEEIIKEQQTICKIRPADPAKKDESAKILEQFSQLRGKPFFYNFLSTGRGYGALCELADGSIKYDLINGIGVNIFGHAHPLYIEANLEAALCDTVMCGNLLAYPEPMELSKRLLATVSNTKLKHFWFAGSGSLSNDNALKIIWQKTLTKHKVIALEKAFAGRSIAMQNITHNKSYSEDMPDVMDVVYAPNYDYQNPSKAIEKTINGLNKIWDEEKDKISCLMIELVQGEGGFIYGTKEYYKAIADWARQHKVYLWIDEVQSFTRTHELFAFQMFELDEYVDICTVGKALQCCGLLFSEELNPKPGLVAGTFIASLASLKAGAKTLDLLTTSNLYGNNGLIAKIEHRFISKLKLLSETSCKGKIGYAGGVGTMLSFEVGSAEKDETNNFLKNLFNNGVIAFSAGKNPTRVRLLTPVTLSELQIDEIISIIEKTVLETF